MDNLAGRPFIRGLELSEWFYREAVKPILTAHFPSLVYSAALIGPGSDVLGFDTPQSVDHDWGPRVMLFLREADLERYKAPIVEVLRQELPTEVCGYPTHFARHEDGTTVMQAVDRGPVNHRASVYAIQPFFEHVLKWDPGQEPRAIDWLTWPQQYLRSLTAGLVFDDGLDRLEKIRDALRYYPRDVWLYLMAAQWQRISQEEAFMGRCGQVGDPLGSQLVAARLIRDLMGLCFLMERQYAPYIKWFGTAFARLECAPDLFAIFAQVLPAVSWQEREKHLSLAYEIVARMHNDLHLTEPLSAAVSPFHNRPFLVPHAGRFVEALGAAIVDPEVQALPLHLGSVDQFCDSTDVLDRMDRVKGMEVLYR